MAAVDVALETSPVTRSRPIGDRVMSTIYVLVFALVAVATFART